VQERLDMVVANSLWCERFPTAGVYVETALTLDHALLWIQL
jgi:hypothetical protein